MRRALGATFSHLHINHLGLDLDGTLSQATELGLAHLRLGAYWSELEPSPGTYQFTTLKKILHYCEEVNQPVVLSIGVKAPRWPEFYWPDFIAQRDCSAIETQQQLLQFIQRTVEELQSFSYITHWQVENEPLDPSGPDKHTISETFLAQEIELVRSLDSRPIMVTLWGNELLRRGYFPAAEKLADVIGIDLYYKVFLFEVAGKPIFVGPLQSNEKLTKLLQTTTKPIWLAELQAEPWEKDEAHYLSDAPTSISPEQLAKNLAATKELPIQETLLWGLEYWLWRATQGDTRYLELIKSQL